MPRIDLEYFAILRDQAGRQKETRETNAASLAALYDELTDAYGFTLSRARLRVAVNAAFSTWEQPVNEGDIVVFIPPVSGG
ncbi:MoaD/ThiS family protein [Kozakia baliensis]|uniref:Molybdopterin synthase sulfur carrier subunit n=1 Tax=Kozakia baliensis TaxID=153496 RepID=A0A1D8UQX9_9PROT|nr:MoaD/ThiS family protein [Kozakia baliensis]AOX15927.1 molybdopterin synthase sulfur carrier subunit [Kozakia baliensis]GBR27505.1 molybdopterin converting factor small subunit [Kozakia baliensis NRIC 0488]GEL64186.1 molybdopterin synthase sulfur carrier subunit [Kozakia baliensis]